MTHFPRDRQNEERWGRNEGCPVLDTGRKRDLGLVARSMAGVLLGDF